MTQQFTSTTKTKFIGARLHNLLFAEPNQQITVTQNKIARILPLPAGDLRVIYQDQRTAVFQSETYAPLYLKEMNQ